MKIRNKYRTHTCGELRATDAGKTVTLCGFYVKLTTPDVFEIRDRHGATRIGMGPRAPEAVRDRVKGAQPEDVVQVTGDVTLRVDPDPSAPTGEVFIAPRTFTTITRADPMPPDIGPGSDEATDLRERLRWRYLDLRRPALQKRIAWRSRFLLEVRKHLAEGDFLEIETPLLAKFSPEDAAAFFVPATPGLSYALPQSPQLYKQLLMVAGFDRYFQIARCFRNERRLGPDRQPEFTALDIEMAYIDEEDIYPIVDDLMAHLWKTILGKKLDLPVKKLTYEESIRRYGTDRPDTRFGLELIDLTQAARRWPIEEVKAALAEPLGAVRAIKVPAAEAKFETGGLEGLPTDVRAGWQAFVTYARGVTGGLFTGPIAKSLEAAVQKEITAAADLKPGDVLVIVAAPHKAIAAAAAGDARNRLGRMLKLIDRTKHDLLWVHQFPFYEYDPVAMGWTGARHPFSQPLDEDEMLLSTDKYRARVKAYDLVLNGVELGAGSIRVVDPETQQRIFDMFEHPPQEVSKRFGFVMEAFKFGVPPHGGLSIGLDRLIALLLGVSGMEEVIAFPKARDGTDPMADAPSPIDEGLVRAFLG